MPSREGDTPAKEVFRCKRKLDAVFQIGGEFKVPADA